MTRCQCKVLWAAIGHFDCLVIMLMRVEQGLGQAVPNDLHGAGGHLR
jgi:hypothetical protein